MTRRITLLALLFVAALEAFAGTGRVIIINSDKAGQGFNDPTPATPIGGNNGTTLGQQRLNVFEAAAFRWQSKLDTNVDIRVTATFAPIAGCTDTEGVLGQAAPMDWRRDFTNAPRANTWYPIALANKFAGTDLLPSRGDIFIQFNASVDQPTCLGTRDWYYGLDGKHGDDFDLFVVVLHEMAHGLGVSGATSAPEFRDNRPAVFDTYTLDLSAGLRWDQMTAEQRRASALNTGNVVWDGENVRNFAPMFLKTATTLAVTAPAPVVGNYDIGLAEFGPSASNSFLSGRITLINDEATEDGPTTTDGCTPLTNAGAVAGRFALVDRGTCTFVTKARNAQAAGAIGLIVIDNTRETCNPPAMSGTAADITIPTLSITKDAGEALKTQLAANVQIDAALRIDGSQLAGTKDGYVRLYAPCTLERGSSIHHWDTPATPNLLMEPFIGSDLLHGVDLTLYQLLDIGWALPTKSGRRILKR
jgi:PA domain